MYKIISSFALSGILLFGVSDAGEDVKTFIRDCFEYFSDDDHMNGNSFHMYDEAIEALTAEEFVVFQNYLETGYDNLTSEQKQEYNDLFDKVRDYMHNQYNDGTNGDKGYGNCH